VPLRIKDNALLVRLGLTGLAAGTEEDSCCCPDCCCIEGKISHEHTTQEACQAAGGVWHTPLGSCQAAGMYPTCGPLVDRDLYIPPSPPARPFPPWSLGACSDPKVHNECFACLCSCASYKKVCREKVVVRRNADYQCRTWCNDECPPDVTLWVAPGFPLPGGDPAGTYFVEGRGTVEGADLDYPPEPYCEWIDWRNENLRYEGYGCSGGDHAGTMYMIPDNRACQFVIDEESPEGRFGWPPSTYYYWRYRLVDDCSECVEDLDAGIAGDDGQVRCREGVEEAYCTDPLTPVCENLVPYPQEGWQASHAALRAAYGYRLACACAQGISFCANEFP